jgi:hypothetical protein
MSRSGPSQVRLSSEQYPASASACPIPPGPPSGSPAPCGRAGRFASINAAACSAFSIIGANQAMPVVSSVSPVAVISSSALVTFWVL